jgi:hypothetical protein
MKILGVRQFRTADQIVLSARCKVRRIGLDDLVFRIPARFEEFVCADASPFAAALLLPAMKLGEDLVIEGSISERLHTGMKEIVRIVADWDIGLKPISVVADELIADTPNSGVSGAFFSGGVDSFYTYLSHRNDPDPITHLLLVNGFDIDPHNPGLWHSTVRNMRDLAAEADATLIEIEGNFRSLTDPILSWPYAFGGCMAAAALCLRGGLEKIYIASGYPAAHQVPSGSHHDIDHLWSTETLGFIHDGSEVMRIDKVSRQIARSPLALKYLRVCVENEKGEYNCGKCIKCLLTMVNLYLAGVLGEAATLPHEIDVSRYAALTPKTGSGLIFHRECLTALQERDLAPDLQAAIQSAIAGAVDERHPRYRRLTKTVDLLDHSYARGTVRKLKARITDQSF